MTSGFEDPSAEKDVAWSVTIHGEANESVSTPFGDYGAHQDAGITVELSDEPAQDPSEPDHLSPDEPSSTPIYNDGGEGPVYSGDSFTG